MPRQTQAFPVTCSSSGGEDSSVKQPLLTQGIPVLWERKGLHGGLDLPGGDEEGPLCRRQG